MRFRPEYRNFRRYAKNYNYYFYRRNLDTRLPVPICLAIGFARLAYFMLAEWWASSMTPVSRNADLLVLVGSENNRKAYGLIRKHLPPHDIAAFHTYSWVGGRINFLRAYCTGLRSLRLVPALVLRRARYARLVCKNLDVFALANGVLARSERHFISGYSRIVCFSEYSAYVNLILASRNPDSRLVYFPHARLPRRHHRFLASDVIVDASAVSGVESGGVRLHPVEGLNEAISRGNATSVASPGRESRGKRVLLCTNTLDSPWAITMLVRKVRRRLAGEGKVLVRMHPAEKFRFGKAVLYTRVGGADIDRSDDFADALSGTQFVYGGFTGALIEAVIGGARVYSSVPSGRLVEYFNVDRLASVGDERQLLDDIVRVQVSPAVYAEAASREGKSSAFTDDVLRRVFIDIFGTGEC